MGKKVNISEPTPGPWIVGEQAKIKTRAGATVALAMSNAAKDPDQFWANATLIAAAPDLLHVAREVAEDMAADGNVSDATFELLKAALAKAEWGAA